MLALIADVYSKKVDDAVVKLGMKDQITEDGIAEAFAACEKFAGPEPGANPERRRSVAGHRYGGNKH